MSIFPTKILLATDGSREAELAGQTAADIANKTASELHVLHVLASPLATHDPSSFEPEVWARLEQKQLLRIFLGARRGPVHRHPCPRKPKERGREDVCSDTAVRSADQRAGR
jgi:nucleotide-binding universal stress UspA family protein